MLDETERASPGADETNHGASVPLAEILEVFGAEPLEACEAEAETTQSAPVLERLAAIEQALEHLQRQASFLPPKLRGLGERVDALGHTLSDSRARSLLLELLGLDDLVRAGLTLEAEGDAGAPARMLAALSASFDALFESQGLTEIATDGDFDPTRHQAVRQLAVDEAEHNGVVLEVDRRGFAHGGRVLRFAEVAVGRHAPHDDESP